MRDNIMLVECLDCEETYLADDLCDGCKCSKCNGHLVERGFIKEMEESIKEIEDKINRAKNNGLIRKYIPKKPTPAPIERVKESKDGSTKQKGIELSIELDTTELKGKLDEIEEQLDRINNKSKVLNCGELYMTGTSILNMNVDEISNTAIKEMAEVIKDTIRMLVYKE